MLRYWPYAAAAPVFMALEVLADLLQPRLMARVVDEGILGAGGVPDRGVILSAGLAMLATALAGGACGVLSGVFSHLFGQNCGNDVRKLCYGRILAFSFGQTERFSVGALVTRVTGDVTQLQNMLALLIRGSVRCGMFLVAGSIALAALAPDYGIVVAAAVPLILAELAFVVVKTHSLFARLQRGVDAINTRAHEAVTGLRVIKACAREERAAAEFAADNGALAGAQFAALLVLSTMHPVINIVLNLAVAGVIALGAAGAEAGEIAPGNIMAAVTYLSQILNGMMMLIVIFQAVTRGVTSAGRIREVLREAPGLPAGDRAAAPAGGSVAFRNASFRYPGGSGDVLSGVNLEIRPGETFGIIGATGCGKTTLVSLIPRFFDVTGGSVAVDGTDVRDLDPAALREKIAFAFQKSELFALSLADNIGLGRPGASREEIARAARAAQAEEFILARPRGYDAVAAEGGASLSGGQRQRIAVARALLRNARILILDDATSALDYKTEARLADALAREYPGVTKIVVALRVASLRHADRIAVIDRGGIAAVGTHAELLASSPVYAEMYASQTGAGAEAGEEPA